MSVAPNVSIVPSIWTSAKEATVAVGFQPAAKIVNYLPVWLAGWNKPHYKKWKEYFVLKNWWYVFFAGNILYLFQNNYLLNLSWF